MQNLDNSAKMEELNRAISDANIANLGKNDLSSIDFDSLPDNFNFLKSYLTKPRTISEIIHREKSIASRRAKNKQAAKARAKNRR